MSRCPSAGFPKRNAKRGASEALGEDPQRALARWVHLPRQGQRVGGGQVHVGGGDRQDDGALWGLKRPENGRGMKQLRMVQRTIGHGTIGG